jgi:DNA polymerase
MDELTLDWETYYDSQYSLKNMPTVLYVRDERFLIHGLGVQFNDNEPQWLMGADIHNYLSQIDWPNTALIGHNLLFDALVLTERYGFKPAEYRDTRYMVNAFLPRGLSRSLNSSAAALSLGAKIEGTLASTKGLRELGDELLAKLGEYCIQDVALTKQIHDALWPNMPENERRLMHMTTRMGVECTLELDAKLLETELQEKADEQRRLIEASGVGETVLRSDKQFFELLQTVADDAPTKTNDSGKIIPALSKLDDRWAQFKANHPELKPLTDGREAAKSNILIKRPELFLRIAKAGDGKLPMPYLYYGAHTGRWSGTDGMNVQNIPSSRISRLRRAIRAPKGYVMHISDSSQIELRFQLWFSGQLDLLEQLVRSDWDDSIEDLYVRNARNIFLTLEITKYMRGVGKALELGAQYGIGAPRYRAYLAAGPLGLPPTAISEQEAQKHIRTYRKTHPKTVEMWRTLDTYITAMMDGNCNHELGPLRFVNEAVILPNGLWLDYSGLHHQPDGGAAYGNKKTMHFIWGGTMLENVTQAMARIPLGEWAVQIEKELPLKVVGWTHDEILAIGPESQAEENQKAMEAIMSQPLSWAPGLTLAAEGGFDYTYIDH